MRNLKALLLNRTKKQGDERILFPTPSADTAPSLVSVISIKTELKLCLKETEDKRYTFASGLSQNIFPLVNEMCF